MAREYSDDAAAREKGGALPLVPRPRMAPTLAKAVFALKVGELSQPIKGPTAWHVVRLDELRPSYVRSFDDVRDGIMRTLETRYVKEKRDLRIKAVYQDPTLETNQPAIDALVNRVDPSVFKPKPQAAAK